MDLTMNPAYGEGYRNGCQVARVVTEHWVADNMFCPRCGYSTITHFENNRPVADFYCPNCNGQFELKSKNGIRMDIINDGAYSTMIDRILSLDNPDFLFMAYRKRNWTVRNLFFIPKHFFTPEIIQRRKPLSQNARRAGWVGCNILLHSVPETGKISIVEDGLVRTKDEVLQKVAVANLLVVKDINARGWLFDVLSCVESINSSCFTLNEVYAFEEQLQRLHPDNHNVRAKIRQQLQMLRDRGVIEFVSRGEYRKVI